LYDYPLSRESLLEWYCGVASHNDEDIAAYQDEIRKLEEEKQERIFSGIALEGPKANPQAVYAGERPVLEYPPARPCLARSNPNCRLSRLAGVLLRLLPV
jgi:hypothetical protein